MKRKSKKLTIPKELTTVTPLSKVVAVFVFIALVIIAFLWGRIYQMNVQNSYETTIMQMK
jgi:hypothetical protein